MKVKSYDDHTSFDLGTYVKTDWDDTEEGVIIDMITQDNWWDVNYTYRVEVTFNHLHDEVSTNVTLLHSFDHAALVTATKSLASGNDVRLVYQNETDRSSIAYTELDRIITDPNTTTANIEFRIPVTLPENAERISAEKKIYLYYGYAGAGSPPTSKDAVYTQYDEFNTDTSANYENESGYRAWTYEIGSSRIKADYGAGTAYNMHRRKTSLGTIAQPFDLELKFYPHWTVDGSSLTSDIFMSLVVGNVTYDNSTDRIEFVAQKHNTLSTSLRIRLLIDSYLYDNPVYLTISDDNYHTVTMKIRDDIVIFTIDGHEYFRTSWRDLTLTMSKPPYNYPIFESIPSDWGTFYPYLMASILKSDGYFYIDYYKVKLTVDNPPTISFSNEEIQTSNVTGGNWKSELIQPTDLEKWIALVVKAKTDRVDQSIKVQVLDSTSTLIDSKEIDLRIVPGRSTTYTMNLTNVTETSLYVKAYLAKAVSSLFSDFIYSKRIAITNLTAGVHQEITLNWGTGTDSGNTIYMNQHCKRDFSDVKFIDSAFTEISHYVKEYTEGGTATVFVKMPSAASPMYILYGSSLGPFSHFDNTFTLRESAEHGETASREVQYPLSSFTFSYDGTFKKFGQKSLKIVPLGSSGYRYFYITASMGTWKYGWVEFWLYHVNNSASMECSVSLQDTVGTYFATIGWQTGNTKYYNGSTWTNLDTYTVGAWDGYRIFFNEATDTVTYYRWKSGAWTSIGGAKRAAWSGNYLAFYVEYYAGANWTIWFDNIHEIKTVATMPTFTFDPEIGGSWLPALQEVNIYYTLDPTVVSKSRSVWIGTMGGNAINLMVDFENGVDTKKPNYLVELPIPTRDGNIIQFMGSGQQEYSFQCTVEIADVETLLAMVGTSQTLTHSFLSDETKSETVYIKQITESQKPGKVGYAEFSITVVVE